MKSGEDKPFQPKPKNPKTTHFVGVSGVVPENITKRPVEAADSKPGMKVHEVNFTFMVGDLGRRAGREGMEAKRREVATASRDLKPTCARCQKNVQPKDKFCSECGSSLALQPVSDHEKRGWKLVDYSSEEEASSVPEPHLRELMQLLWQAWTLAWRLSKADSKGNCSQGSCSEWVQL